MWGAAARTAFVGISEVWLSKLLDHRGLTSDDGVFAKVERLIRDIIPKVSDTELALIMGKRGDAKAVATNSLISAETLAVATDSLDTTDAKACSGDLANEKEVGNVTVVKAIREYLKTKGLSKATGSKSLDIGNVPKTAAVREVASHPAKLPKKPASIDLATARRYLPQVRG